MQMLAKTFKGLEDVLAKELENLNASNITILHRAVSFSGNKELLYKANFHLRTALKILLPIKQFKAKNEYELYNEIKKIRWAKYLDLEGTFAIDSVVNSQYFTNSQYVTYKVKDAIVDQYRANFNIRPSINTKNPSLRINLHISEENCTLSLDSSGESLHKRGYRLKSTEAPLNEVLAAGMIYLSGWDKKSTFVDPMCGSGTILIEAALMAYNIPPGIFRKKYGFETWKDFNPKLLNDIFNEEYDEPNFEIEILGSDISQDAIDIAYENIVNCGLKKKIKLQVKAIEDLIPPKSENGMMVTNPPYGERLKKDDINDFYKIVGDSLKNKFSGYNVWLISNNFEAIKNIGLHTSKKYALYNGALECKFINYSMYKGSMKKSKQ